MTTHWQAPCGCTWLRWPPDISDPQVRALKPWFRQLPRWIHVSPGPPETCHPSAHRRPSRLDDEPEGWQCLGPYSAPYNRAQAALYGSLALTRPENPQVPEGESWAGPCGCTYVRWVETPTLSRNDRPRWVRTSGPRCGAHDDPQPHHDLPALKAAGWSPRP